MRPYRFIRLTVMLLPVLAAQTACTQQVAVYDSLPQLEERIRNAGDNVLVINFWATWCPPCVEELPHFEAVNQHYAGKNVQVVLVSLDFKNSYEKKLLPFVREKQLRSEVALFADREPEVWMPRFDEQWDGALPATVVLKNGVVQAQRVGEFASAAELEAFIRPTFPGGKPAPASPSSSRIDK